MAKIYGKFMMVEETRLQSYVDQIAVFNIKELQQDLNTTMIYIHLCAMIYIHTYMHTCIHAYMHACMHAYIHTYIYCKLYVYVW